MELRGGGVCLKDSLENCVESTATAVIVDNELSQILSKIIISHTRCKTVHGVHVAVKEGEEPLVCAIYLKRRRTPRAQRRSTEVFFVGFCF